MNPIFANAKLQTRFEQDGFVKIPLLSNEQAEELTSLFNSTSVLHSTVATLHHTTTDTQNEDLIRKVDSAVKEKFAPGLAKILVDFKPLVGCFHVKESGADSATGMHQDPTFVDEAEYFSANVWVALHDMNEQNGNLFFIPGSNRAVASFRITPDSPNYYESFSDSLREMAVQVPLKKGEAVIFNNATIHGATDNLSGSLRLAATLLICSKPADWLIYYKEKNESYDKIEKYGLDLETFISIPKNGRPDSKSFKQYVSYEFPKLTKEEFLKATGQVRAKTNYFQRVKDVFKRRAFV